MSPERLSYFAFLGLGKLLDRTGLSNVLDANIPLHLKKIDITNHKIGPELDGFRILHLTDLHFNGSDKLVKRLAEKIDGMKVDLVVMTGDYHKGKKETCAPKKLADKIASVLKGVQTRHGVYATLGNHDPKSLVTYLEQHRIKTLRDEVVDIALFDPDTYNVDAEEPQTTTLDERVAASSFMRIVGIDYETCKNDVEDIDVPYADPAQFSVVLAHTPRAAHAMATRGYDLYLTGHTHGGQIRRFIKIHRVLAERVRAFGLWCEEQMLGYTSCGVGTSGFPFRRHSEAEVTLFTLKAAL